MIGGFYIDGQKSIPEPFILCCGYTMEEDQKGVEKKKKKKMVKKNERKMKMAIVRGRSERNGTSMVRS